MHLLSVCAFTLTLSLLQGAAGVECPCGWRLPDQDAVYTHRLDQDFSSYTDDLKSILNDSKAEAFNRDWMVYDY